MVKKYGSMKEILDATKISKTTRKKLADEMRNKNLSHFLFTVRCENKLTQKDISTRLKWSQTKVSNIESSYNDSINIGDFMSFLNACNLKVNFEIFDKNIKTVDLIRFNAMKIHSYLDQLRELAKGDKLMTEAIHDFHEEAEMNLNRIVRKSKSLLGANKKAPSIPKTGKVMISRPSAEAELQKKEN